MKITFTGRGTRGDVQPLLVLAYALQDRGHAVRLVAPSNMRAMAERAGVPFVALPLDTQQLFATEDAQRMLVRGDTRSFVKWVDSVERPHRPAMRRIVVDAASDADAVITNSLMQESAAAVGAARRIPILPVYFFPLMPSSTFASPFITTKNLGPLNRLTYKLLLHLWWKGARDEVATMRRELGIAAPRTSYSREIRMRRLPCVLAYSSQIFPTPVDYGSHLAVVGSLLPPAALRHKFGEAGLSADLSAWLDSGEPPIYLGFGSMPVLDVARMLELTREALRAVGRRAVIAAGWSAVAAGGDKTLYAVDDVDHQALFARCVAAAHHGGSGTIYASLREGCPTLVCSIFADQPFWGARVTKLGVGATVPFTALNATSLTAGLRQILSAPVRRAAQQLGAKLACEDAVAHAVRIVEETLPGPPPPAA